MTARATAICGLLATAIWGCWSGSASVPRTAEPGEALAPSLCSIGLCEGEVMLWVVAIDGMNTCHAALDEMRLLRGSPRVRVAVGFKGDSIPDWASSFFVRRRLHPEVVALREQEWSLDYAGTRELEVGKVYLISDGVVTRIAGAGDRYLYAVANARE